MSLITSRPSHVASATQHSFFRSLPFLVGSFCLILAGGAEAELFASPDIQLRLDEFPTPTDLRDHDVAELESSAASAVPLSLGSIEEGSDLSALSSAANGDSLVAFDRTTALSGGVVARAGDVMRYAGVFGGWSLEFSPEAEGIPRTAMLDAVSLYPPGLLFSVDTTVVLPGGVYADDTDLILWDGDSFSTLLDASAVGVGTSLDVDGVHAFGPNHFAVSFDTGGIVGGVVFADEDILEYEGGSWTLYDEASRFDADFRSADLDAIQVPEPSYRSGILLGLCVLAAAVMWRRPCSALGGLSAVVAVVTCVPGASLAADGVFEINQTCATLSGCFPGDGMGFPVEITSAAGASSFRLSSSLEVGSGDTTAIMIALDGITLDLGGFKIFGPGVAGTGKGIDAASRNDITVRNGSVENMGSDGIAVDRRGRLQDLYVGGNGGDGIVSDFMSIVQRCSVEQNGGDGIGTSGAVVIGNRAANSGIDGIRAGNGSVVVRNFSRYNGEDGIQVRFDSLVLDNASRQNSANALHVPAGTSG